MRITGLTFTLVVALLLLSACDTTEESRRWVGPEYFPMPLHDWSQEGDAAVARPSSYGGRWKDYKSRLYHATTSLGTQGDFRIRFRAKRIEKPKRRANQIGIWLGLKSSTPSPLNAWIHPQNNPFFVGISPSHTLQVGNHVTRYRLDPDFGVDFELVGSVGAEQDLLTVFASSGQSGVVTIKKELPAGTLSGALSLFTQGKGAAIRFENWRLEGDALIVKPERSMGPILWTQYTLQDSGTLKLQAQMVPLETTDANEASLQFEREGDWETVATATLEPFSSTFLFRVAKVSGEKPVPYRVVYTNGDSEGIWSGTVRANPKDEREFTLGVFNCDHGELFPQDTMVGNVMAQDPDMLFFAGDQIYEEMDKVQVVREPLEGARLSYLSKYYQFGLTWRHLLKDRPSVIIPDDHDVFMPNVWGESGLGYDMPPQWVNMVQRTQTGSLPDPIDPTPVERGIEVYFTALDYAGMSFAVIEDRKFKSHPRITHPTPQNLANAPALDRPEAILLGDRQLSFLRKWRTRTEQLPVRWFLSQSMFSKGNTHVDGNLRRLEVDTDSNGWPQSGRKRALRAIGRDTIMVNGDQHIGMLSRLGIDTWEDGPLSFMVTGSSVGHPRAWWPDRAPEHGHTNGPYTGQYLDDFGNYLTVLGVTNPTPPQGDNQNAWSRPDIADQGPFAVQAAKGSGHGLVIVDKLEQTARFEAYRLKFDAAQPQPTDQFEGFPITQPLR